MLLQLLAVLRCPLPRCSTCRWGAASLCFDVDFHAPHHRSLRARLQAAGGAQGVRQGATTACHAVLRSMPPALPAPPLQVGHELDSLTAVIDQLDADAAGESRLNQEMAGVTLGRLQSGRAAAERTLGVLQVRAGQLPAAAGVQPGRGPAVAWLASVVGCRRPVLRVRSHVSAGPRSSTEARAAPTPRAHTTPSPWPQAFAAAETAYARAMSAVAKLSLCSEADGPTLRAAMQQFSDLPELMGTSHSSVRRLGTLPAPACATARKQPLGSVACMPGLYNTAAVAVLCLVGQVKRVEAGLGDGSYGVWGLGGRRTAVYALQACIADCRAPAWQAPPQQVSERLQEAIRGMQALVTDLRAACDEVVHGAARAKREVEAARQVGAMPLRRQWLHGCAAESDAFLR